MTWPLPFRLSQRLVTMMAAMVAAASATTFASAQTAIKPAETKDAQAETHVSSERMSGRPDREIVLDDDVEIIRGDTVLNADHATYWIVDDEIEASGNVRIKRFGDRFTGDKLRFKMDEGTGYVTNPTYWMQSNNGQGGAERIDFEGEDRSRITEGTYSTCEGPDPDWYLKSDTMTLDSGRNMGTGGTTMVYFKGVPIIGTPYISFPLSDDRKSGFLPPTMGTTNNGGFELMVPYYFNIAPNRDFTLLPRYIARRGFQLGGEARYLDRNYAGVTKFEYLSNDMQTKTDRYSIASTHAQSLGPRSSFGWNINAASDDDYPADFSRNLAISTQRLLLRDLHYTQSGDYWSATARASNYQVLQDVGSPITRPYDRLPQVTFTAGRQDVGGFDWAATAEATRFWHPELERGERYVVNPSLSYPIVRPGYFVTPKISLNAASYSVENPLTRTNASYSRTLPTFSLDSGLIFERETNLFGEAATQTLEPRLFYVRTPYRNQANPIFDSALADLSFAQIFSENRFIGNDRISDANQLTTALVSRYIEASGEERLRVALAQRFYFDDQRVAMPGAEALGDSKSDFLASGSVRISNSLSTEGNLQYSSSEKAVSRGNVSVSWRPEPKKVLNLAYRVDVPNALRQVDVSGQWPIGDRWYGVGRLNYSLSNNYTSRPSYRGTAPPTQGLSEGLLGMEYKADCWIFRVVAQRIPTATGKSTTSLFFQLELSGLTQLGSSPMEALRRSVPGYQTISNNPGSFDN